MPSLSKHTQVDDSRAEMSTATLLELRDAMVQRMTAHPPEDLVKSAIERQPGGINQWWKDRVTKGTFKIDNELNKRGINTELRR